MKPRVFVTRTIPDEGLRILDPIADVDVFPHDRPIRRDELLAGVRGAAGLLCLLTDRVDAAVMDAAPDLAVIATYAVGFDNIDVAAARTRGIAVTNTPGVLTDATADIAFALLIDCARRISECDRWMRTHAFDGWAPMPFRGLDLAGRTVGVVGAGRIGTAMAQRCAGGFGMRVLYASRSRNEELERRFGAVEADLETLLRESDFVSLHVPLTPDTRHLIGANELDMMKPSAVLVNTARGPVVDEAALIDALERKRIFAAGFDVYEHEPKVPEALRRLDNAVILPHIGSASIGTRAKMAVMAAGNIAAVLRGETPPNAVV